MVCSIIAEVNRDTKKRSKPFSPADFMPKKESEPLPDNKMTKMLRRINKILGGDET